MQFVIALAFHAVYLYFLLAGWSLTARTWVKPIGIILSGFGAVRLRPTYSKWVGTGLLICSVGDILLEVFEVYQDAFLYGVGAFFLGHVCYIRAFYSRLDIATFLPFYGFGAAMYWYLLPGLPSDLVIPVAVYTAAIATMGATAATRFADTTVSFPSRLASFVGAVVFMASDSILAINQFRNPLPHAKLLVMLTYYSAQFLMGMSAEAGGNVDGKGLKPKNRVKSA